MSPSEISNRIRKAARIQAFLDEYSNRPYWTGPPICHDHVAHFDDSMWRGIAQHMNEPIASAATRQMVIDLFAGREAITVAAAS